MLAEYERLCATPSDIWLHLPRFVSLVFELNAQHVIELGTRSGVSTVAWLHGLSLTGGRLTSIDLEPGPAIEDEAWTFIQGSDVDPDVVGQLDTADIVFIDTSHHYAHTLEELNVYRWLVRSGGVIVLHDTELARPEGSPVLPKFPVKTAVTEFCEANSFEWSNDPRCFGLAEIRIP